MKSIPLGVENFTKTKKDHLLGGLALDCVRVCVYVLLHKSVLI